MLIFDIETGPGPWDEIEKFMSPFDPSGVKGTAFGEFDESTVSIPKTVTKAETRQKKIDEARKAHEEAVAKTPQLLADAESEHKAAFLSKAALEPTTGRVLAIGYHRVDTGKGAIDFVADQRGEDRLLAKFWDQYQQRRNAGEKIAGHNIFGFDLPFLIRRSWALSIDVPETVMKGRYFDSIFVDTQDVWLCGRRWGSEPANLDVIDKFFGGSGKNGNGAEFARLFETDRNAALAYLRNDLEITARVAGCMGVV